MLFILKHIKAYHYFPPFKGFTVNDKVEAAAVKSVNVFFARQHKRGRMEASVFH